MKKLLLVVALFIVASSASAQFSYGIKGGFNFANITKLDDSKAKPSFYLGAYGEYEINELFGIQPELVYSRQGSYSKEEGVKEWLRANYLNIAVMAKIYVLENLSVDLGPQFGILLNAKIKEKDGGDVHKSDADDFIKGSDFSFGLGLSYKLSPWFDISARYNIGLSDISKDVTIEGRRFSEKNKNSVFQLGVGYKF